MTEEQKKYADYLRDDFLSIKSEIGRRSNLQRYVLAAYIGLVALVMKFVMEDKVNIELIIAVYGTLILAQVYKYREWLEIKRLGLIIKEKITPILRELLNLDSDDQIFHSQTNPYIDSMPRVRRRILSCIFNCIIFVIVPLLVSANFLINNQYKCLYLVISLQLVTILTTLLIEHIFDISVIK